MGAFLKVSKVLFGGIILTLFFSSQTLIAQAAINEQIAFYGTLQDTLGTNLVGTYDMVFRFYDAPSGGTLLDTSTHTVANGNPVVVSAGEFRVQLGSGTGNALNGLNFNTDNIYIGLTIGSDSEMNPRERLSAAPYAFNSDRLDGYDSLDLLRLNTSNTISASTGTTLLSIIQSGVGDILNIFDGGTEVFSILDGGNVGVGTSSPASRFTVAGDVRVTGAFRDTSGDAGSNGMVLISTLTGTNWVATSSLGIAGGGGSSLFTDGGATTYLTAIGDNLAIGSTTATEKLTVSGNVNLAGNFGYGINGVRYLYASTSNDSISFGESAGANFLPDDVYNIAIGYQAAANSTTTPFLLSYNVIIGNQAGYQTSEFNSIMIGSQAGHSSYGTSNLMLGEQAGYGNSGNSNNLIASFSGYNNRGDFNNIIGENAGYNNTGNNNDIFGESAAYNNSGSFSIIFGNQAGYNNSGDDTILIGNSAGSLNSGVENILIGKSSGLENVGSYNEFIGTSVAEENTGNFNQFIGFEAGTNAQSTSSVAIGSYALRGGAGIALRQLVNNTVIGYRAGYSSNTGADNNILIGYQAADNLSTGNNNIIIGYDIDNITATADNRLNIGNLIFGTAIDGTGTTLSTGNIGVGTTTPAQKLQVFGNIRVGTTGSNGCLENFGGGVIGGTCSSDERLKENITELATADRNYLDKIVALKPVSYTWNDLAKKLYKKNGEIENIGLIAQSVEEQFPELVSENTEGYRQVDFGALPFYIIEAVKELYAKVTGLEEKVKEIDELKERIERLEAETGTQYTPPSEPEVEEVSAEDVLPEAETVSEPVAPTQEEPEAPPEPEVTQTETAL